MECTMTTRSQQSRRISSLLLERRVSGVAMVAVLSVALLCGCVGFAAHLFWIIAIVDLALGLGFVIANTRQDRNDIAARRDEDVAAGGEFR
jgi:hypothetical protein